MLKGFVTGLIGIMVESRRNPWVVVMFPGKVLFWCVLVSYFCFDGAVVLAMPHREPVQFRRYQRQISQQQSEIARMMPPSTMADLNYDPLMGTPSTSLIMTELSSSPSSADEMFTQNGTRVIGDNNDANGANPAITTENLTVPETETAAAAVASMESEPNINTSTIPIEGGQETGDTIKTTAATSTMEFTPNNEISRPSLSSSSASASASFPMPLPPPAMGELAQEEEEQEKEKLQEAEVPLFNSIPPTIAAEAVASVPASSPTSSSTSSVPLLPPPVIDPVSSPSYESSGTNDNSVIAITNGEVGRDTSFVTTTTTTTPPPPPPPFYATAEESNNNDDFPLSIVVPGASSPSVLLIPPPAGTSPAIPLEPERGQLPESPEPDTPHHPFNLQDIPISLVSLSGNSGGSTSDAATFSSLSSPPHNVPVDFNRFRYHVVTGQLFKIGSTGPGVCPENMRFFAVPGHPKNGACDCDYYDCSRPLLYSPQRHQCFWAWSKGPCDTGEWFVFSKDLRRRGECQKNPCPALTSLSLSPSNDTYSSPYSSPSTAGEYTFQNPTDGACYQTGTQGYCKDNDERLLVYPGEPIPKCRKFTLCYPLTVPQELQCIYGNKYFVESGQCQ